MYSKVLVSTMISLSFSTNGGTIIFTPLSKVAGLYEDETVCPFKATSVSAILQLIFAIERGYENKILSRIIDFDGYARIYNEQTLSSTFSDKNYLYSVCMKLNNLEMEPCDLPPHFGAWTIGVHGSLAYICFFANPIIRGMNLM